MAAVLTKLVSNLKTSSHLLVLVMRALKRIRNHGMADQIRFMMRKKLG